jgi:predicted alpha/beta hydrolase family esterase
MKFFIIHGSLGNPNSHWFVWLKKELEKLGHEIIAPQFPVPDQSLEKWMNTIKPYLEESKNEEFVFVGHSIAPAFILSILENYKAKACFLVSGFIGGPLGLEKYDEINKTFTQKEFNFEKIKENCDTIISFASDNDPYVPLKRTKEMTDKINGKLIIIKGAEHFQDSSGYNTFKELLNEIKKIE